MFQQKEKGKEKEEQNSAQHAVVGQLKKKKKDEKRRSMIGESRRKEDENDNGDSIQLKGRILLYSISGCPHCRAAKGLLKEKHLPFVEVNLDVYPERRPEMIERTSMRTVPQIFFNDVYVGGNDKLQEVIATGRFDELVELVKTNEVPEGAPPPPSPTTSDVGVLESIICEPDPLFDLVLKMRDIVTGLSIRDRTYHLRTYRKCFVGSEAVDWLLSDASGLNLKSRSEAVEYGQRLVEKHFFHHVTHDHDFEDAKLFYRFLGDDEKHTLNTSNGMSSCEPRSATELAEKIRKIILALYDEYLSADGHAVDYEGLAKSDGWKRYLQKVAELQRVTVTSLTREEKLAFFINIYNALVIHATVELGPPTSSIQRRKFFNNPSYLIGTMEFSLNDIENGVLRANKKAVAGFFLPFAKGDPRLAVSLAYPEPRIHFALVCGAKSCPPIKTYRAKDIDESLTAATQSFFEAEGLEIDESKRKVSLSKILQWYHADFGRTDEEMLGWITSFAPKEKADILNRWLSEGKKIKVVYQPYDWGQNKK